MLGPFTPDVLPPSYEQPMFGRMEFVAGILNDQKDVNGRH